MGADTVTMPSDDATDDEPQEPNLDLRESAITARAPDHRPELMAASTAATLVAEEAEARHGEDCDLARMLRTASRFANDVMKFDAADQAEAEDHSPARGQYADLLLLSMASAHAARVFQRDHNDGHDSEEFAAAAEFCLDLWDTAFRQQAIGALGGRDYAGTVQYHYGDGEDPSGGGGL